jgi:hypothetical protein
LLRRARNAEVGALAMTETFCKQSAAPIAGAASVRKKSTIEIPVSPPQ